MTDLREEIVKALKRHTREMEGYSYFGSNPGVPEDDYEEVADEVAAAMAPHCMCEACKGGTIHAGDCAVHNEPAMPKGPCDCGVTPNVELTGGRDAGGSEKAR